MGLLHHPFWLQLVFAFWGNNFQLLNPLWLKITDEGSLPEIRIWSILLNKSDLKWCILLSRSHFLYLLRKTWIPVSSTCTEEVVKCKIMGFSVNNIFVVYVGNIFQHVVGILMGTYCAPHPADIFMYSYQRELIHQHSRGKK